MDLAGILGTIAKYDNISHGPALRAGYSLGIIEAKVSQNSLPFNDARKYERHVADINSRFRKNGWSTEVSMATADTLWKLEDDLAEIIDNYRRKETVDHAAYFLIGNAAGMCVADSSDDDVEQRVEQINVNFRSLRIKTGAFCDLLKQLPIATTSIEGVFNSLKGKLLVCHESVRILFLTASPIDVKRVRSDKEFRLLTEAIKKSPMSVEYTVEEVRCCRLQDLASAIRRHRPTILHFSGHADADGLGFEDDESRYDAIEVSKLEGLMKQGVENGLRTVVLNACSTAEQSECIANLVGCVISMKGIVDDEPAIKFAQVFYGVLGEGKDVKEAFRWAQMESHLYKGEDIIRPQIIIGGQVSEASNQDENDEAVPVGADALVKIPEDEGGKRELESGDVDAKGGSHVILSKALLTKA